MKKLLIVLAFIAAAIQASAQDAEFPFQGGKDVMIKFFGDNLRATPMIIKNAATGMVIMKFTADQKGNVIKTIVYYADDPQLIEPVVAVLKQTSGKWIVPSGQKSYDFIIPFNIEASAASKEKEEALVQFYKSRQQILTSDQVPLNMVTLLPSIKLSYKLL